MSTIIGGKRQGKHFEMFKVFLENCNLCKNGQTAFVIAKDYVVVNKAHWLKITKQVSDHEQALKDKEMEFLRFLKTAKQHCPAQSNIETIISAEIANIEFGIQEC